MPDAGGLFDGIMRRGPVPALVGDAAYVQAMLDVEAALARAGARAGLFPSAHADTIAAACSADRFDLAALGRDAAADGNPVIPLVRALTAAVDGPAAGVVHLGATSQDVLDTATMLVAREALTALAADVSASADAAAVLADGHRTTVIAGRTLMQQALPISFGAKAAGWLDGLDDALAALAAIRPAIQLGGAAGTLASIHPHGPEVVRYLADDLGMDAPGVPWHVNRSRITSLAGALGTTGAALAKPARDVILLAQTEVGEVSEGSPDRGASSTLPHKRNPIAAISVVAATTGAPGLVATLFSAAATHEHERAAGAWHAEWLPLRELFVSIGTAANWLADCLTHLEIHQDRMRANLDLTGGLLLAERVAAELTPALGRLEAHAAVTRAAAVSTRTGRPFAEVLAEEFSPAGLDLPKLFDPTTYLGATGTFIDRALARHAAWTS